MTLASGDVVMLVSAAFGAGVMNAVAGGGTLLTFPALLLAGFPSITANATSAVALVPGAAASVAGYRTELREHRRWLRALLLPSLLGGLAGSMLLLATPEATFSGLAPFLVLFATVLFVAQAWLARHLVGPRVESPSAARLRTAALAQFAVAIYGGYFGAGMGIMMLAILGFLGLSDIHGMNGLKNACGMCINGVAAAWFILRGAIDWPAAALMAIGAAAGGYAGARLARFVGRERARAAVIVIGLLVTVALLSGRL